MVKSCNINCSRAAFGAHIGDTISHSSLVLIEGIAAGAMLP